LLSHPGACPPIRHGAKRIEESQKKQLFLIVPRQRFFRFTLDLRIHFFYAPLYF
jgi:hypothetical protein